MLPEPPLVEIPTATSSDRAWAMSWRAKMASLPMSLAIAVMLAGSEDNETAGICSWPAADFDRQDEALGLLDTGMRWTRRSDC